MTTANYSIMKKVIFYISILSVVLFSCTSLIEEKDGLTVPVITGNQCITKESMTRLDYSYLKDGSKIHLNASGALEIQDETFHYKNGIWTNGSELSWENGNKVHLTALYPALYPYNNLYNEGRLQDILFVRQEYPSHHPINLLFRHLFSRIVFRFNKNLKNKVESITLSIPYTITEINPYSTEISIRKQDNFVTLDTKVSGEYEFIIPPIQQTLQLKIQIEGKEFIQKIASTQYQSNHQYICEVLSAEKHKGIRTAEEFIAFIHLINNDTNYDGPISLDRLYQEKDGRKIYNLLNDISLSEYQNITIDNTSFKFDDIFEGNNHTISNSICVQTKGYTALFPRLGKNGVIRNLNIKETYYPTTAKYDEIGLLVANNNGLIDHCSIQNSAMTIRGTKGYIGTLAGTSYGNIINSSVRNSNITIKGNTGQGNTVVVGMAVGYLYNKVWNSYFYNNNIKTGNNYAGGIFGMSYGDADVRNCYNSCAINKRKGKVGAIGGKSGHTNFKNCYTDDNKLHNISGDKNTHKGVRYFDNEFRDTKKNYSVIDSLNSWVDANQDSFPAFNFLKWKENDTIPAIFISL